jgi:type II secretory ATPase GspE/PulE/Tfp pilus assembly ATPase PilB-like protein
MDVEGRDRSLDDRPVSDAPAAPAPLHRDTGRTGTEIATQPGMPKDCAPEASLVHQGIITGEEYASAVGRHEESGHSIWAALRGAVRLILPRGPHFFGRGEESDDSRFTVAEVSPGERSSPIPELVSNLFEKAIQWRGTDIHLDPDTAGVRIRVRIDGHLHDVGSLPDEVARQVRSRIKILAGMDILEKVGPQDGHICLSADGIHRDFRVATLLTGLGERMVIRFHQAAEQGVLLDALGLDPDQESTVRSLLDRPQGLILIGGPVGSGKTTTLYACLRSIAHPMRSLITIEDPIEYRLDGVCQVEVRPHLGLTFAQGLRAILRQDANVVAVGEIRDRNTARVVSRAASAGSLVLSAVHAGSGAGVLRSLANYRISPYRIGESLVGIIVQRLVRVLCPVCKSPVELDSQTRTTLESWGLSNGEVAQATLFNPVGCPVCLGTGYRGRTGVFEVIDIAELSIGLAQEINWPRVLTKARHCKLATAAARKVARGITTIGEVKRVLPRAAACTSVV